MGTAASHCRRRARPHRPRPPRAGRAAHRNDIQDGDCELVEQFDRDLLQDFTIRNHESHFTCIPHQISLNGIQSRFEVLAPLPKVPAAKGAAAKGGAG